MLAIMLGLLLQETGRYESRTHQDGSGANWSISFRDRTVHEDGSVTFRSKAVSQNGSLSFSEKTCNKLGEPLRSSQEGSWGKLTMENLPEQTKRLIDGKETTEVIPRSKLADPTLFWFWKTQPKPDDYVTVTYAAANAPTTFQIKYTYLGLEDYEAAGRKLKAHKVREDPLGANTGKVYSIRWFDEQGMDIGRYHKTTTNEYTTTLKAWK